MIRKKTLKCFFICSLNFVNYKTNHAILQARRCWEMSSWSNGHMQTAKGQIRLHRCAVWSGPLLSANRIISHLRMYQWRGNARMRLYASMVWVWIFEFCACSRCLFAWCAPNDISYLHVKRFFQPKIPIFFLFLLKNICCGYILVVPHWGISNEYLQHIFSWRNQKKIMWIPTSYLEVWYFETRVTTIRSKLKTKYFSALSIDLS